MEGRRSVLARISHYVVLYCGNVPNRLGYAPPFCCPRMVRVTPCMRRYVCFKSSKCCRSSVLL